VSIGETPCCSLPGASAVGTSGLPAVAGVYLLVMYLPDSHEICVGGLGLSRFRKGWYLYAGSARGPGGIRARCARHLRPDKRQRWHIDYLTQIAQVQQVWFTEVLTEMCIVSVLLRCPKLEQPVAGFGASDSRARSHLFYSRFYPEVSCLPRRMSLYMPE
jgi:Uri superfamily endonuclease